MASPALSLTSSTEEVAEWLLANVPSAWASEVVDHARAHGVNGSILLGATGDDEIGDALGQVKFGRKRKLRLLLETVPAGSSSAPAAPSGDDPAGPDAGVGSSAGAGAGAPAGGEAFPAEDGELDCQACESQLQDECYALGLVKWCGDKLASELGKSQAWANPRVRANLLAELETHRKACELPGVSTVVVGNTGAGKSTLLNALLDETTVLPTNGMRACTATLIELRHEDTPPTAPAYRSEVEFLTQAEWVKELDEMLDDLTPTDGPNAGRVAVGEVQPDSPNYPSWCRLYATYGDTFKNSRVATGEKGPENRTIYKYPLLDELRAKLMAARSITGSLGTVKTVTAGDARSFRKQLEQYMDSTSDLINCRRGCPPDRFGRSQCFCGNYWPIVKQVRAWSRNWSVLSTGGVLIDAPGVHDDNSARDAVVKRKLKDADAVWIVSNIVRAVNDKTAKDMLGEHFRRQLLMDGQFGALAFIATQSDVLDRSEAVRSLRLPAGTTLRECADARNQYAVQRLKQDFGAGLREMAAQAGSADADALVSRFDLPVFTVSAMDYQKIQGLRPADGAPRVWATAEQTLIPRLARHVRRAALVRRKALSLRRCRAMEDFTRGVVGLLEAESRLPAAVRDAAADAYQTREKELRKELRAACAEAEAAVRNDFETLVEPQLKAGANTATTEALRTAEAWPGQMHWATYKATTRRMGVFRLNMNEELTAPILKAVSVQWEQAFLSGLQRTLNKLQKRAAADFKGFYPPLLTALTAAGVPSSASSTLTTVRPEALMNALSTTLAELKDAAGKQQRDLSRCIEPLVQQKMTPGYVVATAEAGTGSHRRRIALLESHVRKSAPVMFSSASGTIVSKLDEMRAGIGAQLEAGLVDASLKSLRTSCSVVWDEIGGATLAERRRLAPRARDILLQATNAVRRLNPTAGGNRLAAAGAAAASSSAVGGSGAGSPGGGEEDEELVDVTEQARAAKRARQIEETIDLGEVGADENTAPQPTPHGGGAGPSASFCGVKVKAENGTKVKRKA